MGNRFIAAATCFILAMNTAAAEPVAEFYQGKQIRLVIRAPPGGNYDLYMRLLARYMVRNAGRPALLRHPVSLS